jgi:SAM-dependent methyltransferase
MDANTRTPPDPDPFGRALCDALQGRPARLCFRRDDGQLDGHDAALYLAGSEDLDPAEATALSRARGRVLDVGCGAGRHALLLQERGLPVVGLDLSPRALKVSRRRGLLHTVLAPAAAAPFAARSFDTILFMGNNLGLGGDAEGTVAMLRDMQRMAREGGLLIAGCRSPATTEDPVHLAYHARNQAQGRPIGQVTMRVEYGEHVGPWFDLLLLTPEQAADLAHRAGWRVDRLLPSERGLFSVVLERA